VLANKMTIFLMSRAGGPETRGGRRHTPLSMENLPAIVLPQYHRSPELPVDGRFGTHSSDARKPVGRVAVALGCPGRLPATRRSSIECVRSHFERTWFRPVVVADTSGRVRAAEVDLFSGSLAIGFTSATAGTTSTRSVR